MGSNVLAGHQVEQKIVHLRVIIILKKPLPDLERILFRKKSVIIIFEFVNHIMRAPECTVHV